MDSLFDRAAIDFQLFEVFGIEGLCGSGRYADHDRESLSAVLDLAQRITEEHLFTHSEKSDIQEPYLKDNQVYVLPEVIEALTELKKAGFFSAHADYEYGGMQLPVSVNNACNGMIKGGNPGTHGFMSLTRAAANLLNVYGSEEQKRLLMKPMLEGRFFGTMCLSEPDVGSSLGDLKTRAEPSGDGSYSIKGNKMWISGGDHDAAENIIHLVLARLPDAPAGVKGISLFAVPKFKVNADGDPGEHNGINVAGLNHKMGYRAISNCLLNFGETDESIGTLVGEPNRGLVAMFHMMNEARISVGTGAAMLGAAGYHLSLKYAKERRQGRRLSEKNSAASPVAIINHPDVRRMLLKQKAYVEGGLALCLYAGTLVDQQMLSDNSEEIERLADLLNVLTPIVKAWPSEFALEANKLAIQVFGGAGYTRDFPMERLYRDNRLNPIHEGTNGIQALDLLGRKAVMNEGRAFQVLEETIRADLKLSEHQGQFLDEVVLLTDALDQASSHVAHTRNQLNQGEAERSLAFATDFLNGMGHVVVGWLLLKQALTAQTMLNDTGADYGEEFLMGKVRVFEFFANQEMPVASAWLDGAASNPDLLIDITEREF